MRRTTGRAQSLALAAIAAAGCAGGDTSAGVEHVRLYELTRGTGGASR